MKIDRKTRIETIPGVYVVSFKRRGSGRLLNIEVSASGTTEASRLAKQHLVSSGKSVEGRQGWREYGVSKATRVLVRIVTWGSRGVFEEWRVNDWQGECVESRELSREEVKAEAALAGVA